MLLRRFKRAEEPVFDRIFGKYTIPAFSICHKQTRDEADTRDISQKVFTKVYKYLVESNERAE